MRANNFSNLMGRLIHYKKEGNKWRTVGGYHSSNASIIRLSPNHLKRYPFLAEKVIKTPAGLPNGTYIPAKNVPSNISFNIYLRNPKLMQNKIAKAERLAKAMQTVRPKLLNLGAKVAERTRKLTGLKYLAEEYRKHFLANTGNLMARKQATHRSANGASGSRPYVSSSGLRKRKYTTGNANKNAEANKMMKQLFGNNYASNSNDPMKRKTARPNSPNTAARKKAKANENAKLERNLAELKRLRNSLASSRTQNERERLARAPRPGVTWKRNNNGTISMVNLNKRKANLERFLQLHSNFVSREQMGEVANNIGNNGVRLAGELGLRLTMGNRYPFHRDTIKNALNELTRVLDYKRALLQKKVKKN